MKTPESVAWSPIRTRSPSSAPPENGLDGSTAITATRLPCSRNARTSAFVEVDLPTPGAPVRPMTWAFPVCGARAAATRGSCELPCSTREISLAIARGSPSRARSTSPATSTALATPRPLGLGRHADDQSVALTTTTAQRRGTHAAATPLQLQSEVQGDAGAGHADRVAQRDGAAVDVDLVLGNAELLGRHDADRRERLVDLDQVEVGGLDALLGAGSLDGVG